MPDGPQGLRSPKGYTRNSDVNATRGAGKGKALAQLKLE
jgi:hypothetical protein